jgi:hypothetical protein
MSNAFIAGTAYFSVDGKNYALVGELSYKLSGTNNTDLNGMDGFHGMKTVPMPGAIKGKIRNGRGVDIAAVNAMANVTVTVELINGKTVVGRNMFRFGEPVEVTGEDATFDLELRGADVRELGVQ